jgi:hypothetical protein
MGAIFWLAYFAFIIAIIVGMWKVFEKAGKPGWAAIIPLYNIIVLLEIVNKPLWWFILLLIPLVNLVIAIMVIHRVALSFGKDVVYTILLIFGIGYILLGFDDSKYTKLPE